MIPGLTSIVIPYRTGERTIVAAVHSALGQTAPVEVLVVCDGDVPTGGIDLRFGNNPERLRVIRQAHAGVATARNRGIDEARGEFVQFLDDDDTLDRDKVAASIAALDPDAGWIVSDVRIVEVNGSATTASRKYGYADFPFDGWVSDYLAVRNFIPVHAPLVRRSAIGDVRFPTDKAREDWHFWHAIAMTSRVRYLPRALATYSKRRGGRNSTVEGDTTPPGIVLPLRLNLGCGKPGARSWHPMRGLVNLDKSLGWRFEDGLGQFADGSVAGITVSHALMYVKSDLWPFVLGEFARVLAPGGVLRITEDDTEHQQSSRRGGWKGSDPAVTLTGPKMARRALEAAGFTVHDVGPLETRFADDSLRQAQHGDAPDCFWIEGVREGAVLFEPHADDAVLFGAFSIIRHRPRVVTCFPSRGDYGDTATRHAETVKAVGLLGGGPCEQWDGLELVAKMRELDARLRPTKVFAPSARTSHPEHLAVAHAAAEVFGDRLVRFQTYDTDGKVRAGDPVPHEPGWAERKRIALSCYASQLAHPRARRFFADDLAEYPGNLMRLGYQVSVRIVAHQANMTGANPPQPVIVLTEVLEGEAMGWTRDVFEVRMRGPSRSEYGWGEERAHSRGRRFDTHVWIFTESPVEYRDAEGWKLAP